MFFTEGWEVFQVGGKMWRLGSLSYLAFGSRILDVLKLTLKTLYNFNIYLKVSIASYTGHKYLSISMFIVYLELLDDK